jgi:DNA mismatch repair protein MutL
MANTYVIAEGPDGLYIIDQHAAHERVRFDRILEQWAKQKVEVQGLLQPITIELSLKEEEIWRGNEGILSRFGFYVESFGGRNYILRAMPVLIANENIREVLTDLFDTLSHRDDSLPWEEKIAQSLACHGAIRAGQQLSNEEMRELISQLEQSKQPRSCPHGRPTIIHMSLFQFEKEFGRRA